MNILVGLRNWLQDKCEPPVYVSDRRFMKAVNLLQVAAHADGRTQVGQQRSWMGASCYLWTVWLHVPSEHCYRPDFRGYLFCGGCWKTGIVAGKGLPLHWLCQLNWRDMQIAERLASLSATVILLYEHD